MNFNFYTLFLLVFIVNYGCGDAISSNKKIKGNYYLVEGDTPQDLAICYRNEYVFSQRVPGKVIKYGYNDSFLVAENIDFKQKHSYYIINMLKDYDTAKHEEIYKIGPLSEDEYKSSWGKRLNISLEFIK